MTPNYWKEEQVPAQPRCFIRWSNDHPETDPADPQHHDTVGWLVNAAGEPVTGGNLVARNGSRFHAVNPNRAAAAGIELDDCGRWLTGDSE